MRLLFILNLLCSFLYTSCLNQNNSLKDLDGNSYPIKSYQGTTWMTKNLKVTKDQDGNKIKFYFPNDDKVNADIYGLLYDYETACKVCPKGWELPTNEDWEKLFEWESQPKANPFKDEALWNGEENSNSSKFGVVPAGYANQGEFDNFFQSKAIFWSKTDHSEHIWTYIFEKDKDQIRKAEQHPTYAFAVRCIKKKL